MKQTKIVINDVANEKDALMYAEDLALDYVSADTPVVEIAIVGGNGVTYEIELTAEVHRIPMDVGEDIYKASNDVEVILNRKYYVVESWEVDDV